MTEKMRYTRPGIALAQKKSGKYVAYKFHPRFLLTAFEKIGYQSAWACVEVCLGKEGGQKEWPSRYGAYENGTTHLQQQLETISMSWEETRLAWEKEE